MMTRTNIVVRLGAVCLLTLSASGQWAVSYVEDPSRVDPAAATDQAEKDYAWGDLDRDGDIDLVVVRKQPWTTTGRRANSPWDLGGDGNVGINDFLALLGAWGPNPGHPADFDGDDVVGILDFLVLLGSWGPCP